MSEDYNEIDGIIKQLRESVEQAFNKGYKQGYAAGKEISMMEINAEEAVKKYAKQKEKQKVFDQDRACPILDDNCPYPYLGCHECEVHCVMERANKKLEGIK